MNVQDALRRADHDLQGYNPTARDLFMNRSYWALVDMFHAYVCFDKPNTVLAGTLAVYGWMPRMLGRCDLGIVARHRDALHKFRIARNGHEGRMVLQDVPLNFVNGSVVGTSKFLHFLNPNVAPIWDRRVASTLGVTPWIKVNCPDVYRTYWGALDKSHFEAPDALRKACDLDNRHASDIRLKEAALYLTGLGPSGPA